MSSFRGGKSAKRLVRNIPDAMRAELVQALDEGGNELLAAMKARTPERTGNLKSGLEKRVYPKSLRLRVGLFAATRRKLGLFYAHILEYGRKAQVVTVKRKSAARAVATVGGKIAGRNDRALAKGIKGVYQLHVGAIAPKRFVGGPLRSERAVFRRKIKGVWERVLKRAAGGVGND